MRGAVILAFVYFMNQVKSEKIAFDKMPGPVGLPRAASTLETYNTCNMDVRLINATDPTLQSHGFHGFVDIHLPPLPRPLFVCFPKKMNHLDQMILLSHAICRQLGHMTSSALHGVSVDGKSGWFQGQNTTLPPRGLSPRTWNCKGHEQAIGQCSWRQGLSLERCNSLMDVMCGECEKVIRGTNGTISTPGYPHTYVYDVSCNWTLEIPWGNDLLLQLQDDDSEIPFACNSCRPYIDIVYVEENRLEDNSSSRSQRTTRYHNFEPLRHLRILHWKIEVHYFSGLHFPRSTPLPRGFQFNFTAIPSRKVNDTSNRLALYIVGGIVLIFALICCAFGLCQDCSDVREWIDDCREPFVSVSESPTKSATPVEEDLPPSYATVKAADQNSPPAFADIVTSDDMDLCLSLDEEINMDDSSQFHRGTFGLRLRSPDISQLEERDEFITVVSTPIEPSDCGEDHLQRTVLRPPCTLDDSANDFKTHVRTKLCDRYSRNSTTNPQCGVFLGDEQPGADHQERQPSAHYLQVDPFAAVKPSLKREKAMTNNSLETSVFLSAEDRTPAWESQPFTFDLDQLAVKNL